MGIETRGMIIIELKTPSPIFIEYEYLRMNAANIDISISKISITTRISFFAVLGRRNNDEM